MSEQNEGSGSERILGRKLAVAEQAAVAGGWGGANDALGTSWDLDNGQFSGLLIYDDLAPEQRPGFRGIP